MPALTFRSVGTVAANTDSSALSPGAPSGKAVGDLLVLVTGNRTGSQTVSGLTGWQLAETIATNGCISAYVRIADGTATDTPSPDWSGTAASYAYIVAYSGDVYLGDIRGIVLKHNAEQATQASPTAPTVGIGRDNALLFTCTQKNKTATSNDATTLTAPASGSLTKRVQNIQTGTGLVCGCADTQQTTATDYDGTDWTINGTAESVGTVGLTFAIRTEDGTRSTILRDAKTEDLRTGTTSPQTFNHAGAASGVKGVLLAIIHGTSSTDHVSAASYGGVAMTRVQRNTDTATEPGAAEIWFLGSGVPQGTQTVSYTPGATTDDIFAVCITLVSDVDLAVIDTDGVNNDAANPSVTLQAAGREIFSFGALYGGGSAPSAFAPNNKSQDAGTTDFGAFYGFVLHSDISAAADFTLGGVAASDDVAYAAAAVAKISERNAPGPYMQLQAMNRAAHF